MFQSMQRILEVHFEKIFQGIVPTFCEELFKKIEEKKEKGGQYEVFISMFEIYCEKVCFAPVFM